jgi:hypothetical protein
MSRGDSSDDLHKPHNRWIHARRTAPDASTYCHDIEDEDDDEDEDDRRGEEDFSNF